MNDWRHSGGLKSFKGLLSVRANTHLLLWFILKLNFMNTFQDSIYLSLKTCSVPSYINTDPFPHRLPIESRPGPLTHPGPICKPDDPFVYRRSPSFSCPFFSSQHDNPIYWGIKLNADLIKSTFLLNMESGCRSRINTLLCPRFGRR